MRKTNLHKTILYAVVMLIAALCFVGCGKGNEKDTETQQGDMEQNKEDSLFLIMEHDSQEESLTLYSFSSGLEHYYEYGFSTQFKDKYGNFASASEFTAGRFVTIAPRDKDGYLTEVMLSGDVWEYEKVRRFQIDEEKGVFTIADTKYSIRDEVKIFSKGEQISFSDISKDDTLTVVGMDKKILSIVVTTGHGTLSLNNTTLFENSFLQLNNDIFAMITPNLEMEVPEGTYTLKVANDGWGGTTEIEIERGEITRVDLETLKGEGKQKGLISFDINVEDVEVYVDYQLIDHTQPIELTYGTHVLKIEAEGYDTWKKYLSVNSKEATLLIELTEESEKDSSEEDEETSEEDDTETKTESETESKESETENETEITTETENQ